MLDTFEDIFEFIRDYNTCSKKRRNNFLILLCTKITRRLISKQNLFHSRSSPHLNGIESFDKRRSLTTGLTVNLHGGKNIIGGRGRKQTRRKRLTVDKQRGAASLVETGANSEEDSSWEEEEERE